MKKLLLATLAAILLPGDALAEDPVSFADAHLKVAVEAELWTTDPTPTDMLGLTSLNIATSYTRENAITDLTGLEYATNLVELDLRYHRVSDLSPLAGLVNLESLDLLANEVSDLSPLSGLGNLRSLDLESNFVSDLSPLSSLVNLESVGLHRNWVSDLSPLTSLTSLDWLDLRADPLDPDAYDIYIPQIQANNPGITLLYDAFFTGQLEISSTIGGSVVNPGEGTFTTAFGEVLSLEAKPDPCFVFVGWSGDYSTKDNPLSLTIDQDYALRANFISVLHTIHVDDNAPADPAPNDPAVSDPRENGTAGHPFDSVSEAIEVAAREGVTIFVHAGTYRENIDLLGKRIELTGFDPNDPQAAAWPVLDGGGNGPVVSFTHGEDEGCLLAGFVVTGGKGRTGPAVRCTGSSPTIVHCLITGNRATDWNGAVVLCTDSNAAFINCTIVENRGGQFGTGLFAQDGHVMVLNSILWGNWPKDISTEGDLLPAIRYSIVAGNWPGGGNLAVDPLFASSGRWVDRNDPAVTVAADDPSAIWSPGDYHVKSQAGRWDPRTGDWLQDEVTSPCVDGGDPTIPVGSEPLANGGIINIGVYGGTIEASRSLSLAPSP